MIIDEKDLRILDILKQNSKLTTQKISRSINIPITTVHNRIKKMENLGIIKGYTLVLDYKKLEKSILAYVLITVMSAVPSGKKLHQENIAKEIKRLPGVEEVNIATGDTDIIVKARVKDVDELNDFLINKLRKIEGIDKTKTMIVLSSV